MARKPTNGLKNATIPAVMVEAKIKPRVPADALPATVHLLPELKTGSFRINQGFRSALADPKRLGKLIGKVPNLRELASEHGDGRRVRMVLGIVRDSSGATRAGIETFLLDHQDKLIDRAHTDDAGLVLLRFPMSDSTAPIRGTVQAAGQDTPVQVASGHQHAVIEIVLARLPETDPRVAVSSLLERLPVDFTPRLCDDVTRLRGVVREPILAGSASPADFRSRRLPLVKRFVVPQVGPGPKHRRFLVRIRQEWTFIGYTLGELDEVEALDPGSVVDERVETFRRSVRQAARSASRATEEEERELRTMLTRLSSIDRIVTTSQSSSVQEESDGYATIGKSAGGTVGGFVGGLLGSAGIGTAVGGALGGWIGGLFGDDDEGASVFTKTTRSGTDTSLRVNSYLHEARARVNTQVRSATSSLRSLSSRRERDVEQVSPLLSRVTNLLRWTLYETYMVCTMVEDVVEVQRHRVAVPLARTALAGRIENFFGLDLPLFNDEDIVEYRRFFQPRMLEPLLIPHFEKLRTAIALRRAGGAPITVVHVAVEYSAVVGTARCRVSIGSREVTLNLAQGDTEARGTIILSGPVQPAALGAAIVDLSGIPSPAQARQEAMMQAIAPLMGQTAAEAAAAITVLNVQVSRIRFWFNSPDAAEADQSRRVGTELAVTDSWPTKGMSIALSPAPRYIDTTKDPLFLHVNRNASYYFGVLLRAAYRIPSLRSDAPQLHGFGPDHEIWRLPIIRFEGTDALVIDEPEANDAEVDKIVNDKGAATIIQIAAPGAYSEALQGLLSLEDAAGKVHPALQPKRAVVVPATATLIEADELVASNGGGG